MKHTGPFDAGGLAPPVRALLASGLEAADAGLLRRQTLALLGRAVGFDEGYFLPFTDEFFDQAPPYLLRFVQNPGYEADLRRPVEIGGGCGSYIDTEVFSRRERDRLPLYRDLLRPHGLSGQLVALVRYAGRVSGVIHLNRHGSSPPFRARDLARVQELVRVVGLLHAALVPSAGSQGSAAAVLARNLTPRQFEIGLLVAEGHQNAQAAARLAISERTVRNQMSEVFRRLGVFSRAELALVYERAGFLRALPAASERARLAGLLRSVSKLVLPAASRAAPAAAR